MGYFLFILVNAALFIRPAEIVPALLGWEIYFYVIVACMVVSIPDVLRYLTGQSIESQPITLCVLGLLVAILIPPLLAGDLAEAWRTGFHFAKIIAYYILFVSLVTSTARLRTLMICLLFFCGTVTLLAVLRYHDIMQLATIESLTDTEKGTYGNTVFIQRLQATGIFQDPNELCVVLSAMLPLCLYFLCTDRSLLLKAGCVTLLPLFGYAVALTRSRGGFIAFVGGLAALSFVRFGWKKTVMIGSVGLPVLLILFAGRQTDISTSTGTAQTRVELWREWLTTWRENMLFGKGMTLHKEEEAKNGRPDLQRQHIAHNALLQGFADLGFFGGCLLVGAFVTAIWSVYRCTAPPVIVMDRELHAMQPYVVASLCAFFLGMLTLSIGYMVPTYMMLALAVAYTHATRRASIAPEPALRFDVSLLGTFALAGFVTLASIYVFVRFLA